MLVSRVLCSWKAFLVVFSCLTFGATSRSIAESSVTVATKLGNQIQQPTHRQVDSIYPKLDGESVTINTFAMSNGGHLYVAVSTSGQSFQQLTPTEAAVGAIMKLDPDGKTIASYKLPFVPSAVAVSPQGRLFAGGNGRIVELDASGKIIADIESPHIPGDKELREKTIKMVLDMRKQMAGSLGPQIESMEERIADIEKTEESDRTRLQTAQLDAFKQQIEMLKEMSGDSEGEEDEVSDLQLAPYLQRVKSITSLAASETDVFICANPPGDFSYNVYRVNHDLDPKSAESILTGLRGCCGQMDIACCDDGLVVSENTKFRVAMYDRDGKALGHFGKQDRSSREGFGSCCNPMNSLPMSDGSILTAESSIGHIKKFTQDGKLVAYIGKASIGGGCKHCELGFDAKSDRYFMMNQNDNSICVLASNQTPMSQSEKLAASRAKEFLQRAVGTWTFQNEGTNADKEKSTIGGFVAALLGGGDSADGANLPVSELLINPDGSGEILSGTYASFSESSGVEVLPPRNETAEPDADTFDVAILLDGARYSEGTWEFTDENTAELTLDQMGQSRFVRLPSKNASTKSAPLASLTESKESECAAGACDKDGCPCKTDTKSKSDVIANLVARSEGTPTEADFERDFEMEIDELGDYGEFMMGGEIAMPRVTYEYKFIDIDDLGRRAEKRFNKLGQEGWEYCGKLKDNLVFKRADGVSMDNPVNGENQTAEAVR